MKAIGIFKHWLLVLLCGFGIGVLLTLQTLGKQVKKQTAKTEIIQLELDSLKTQLLER